MAETSDHVRLRNHSSVINKHSVKAVYCFFKLVRMKAESGSHNDLSLFNMLLHLLLAVFGVSRDVESEKFVQVRTSVRLPKPNYLERLGVWHE